MQASPARFRARDLAAVLVLLALAAGVVVPAIEHRAAARRDAQRLERVRHLQDAIERYRAETGAWPAVDAAEARDGWDASHDGAFLPALVERGLLVRGSGDPLDDERFHFRYRVFESGTCACAGPDGFYVLGIARFETERFAARRPGALRCPHRAWSRELAHVAGGGIDGG
jgi:hypothetical protein